MDRYLTGTVSGSVQTTSVGMSTRTDLYRLVYRSKRFESVHVSFRLRNGLKPNRWQPQHRDSVSTHTQASHRTECKRVFILRMPKTGKSDDAWRARIRQYMAGKFFCQGQRPPSSSKWAKVIKLIDICPVIVNSSPRNQRNSSIQVIIFSILFIVSCL